MATTPFADDAGRPVSHRLLDRGALAVLAITVGLFLAPTYAWIGLGPAVAAAAAQAVALKVLAWSAFLALILPLVQIYLQIKAEGGTAVRGNRVGFAGDAGAGGRVARAHRNLLESLVPFAAAVLAAQAFGVANRATAAAAVLYLAARLVHAGCYIAGVTVVRSAAFYAGLIATFMVIRQLPLL